MKVQLYEKIRKGCRYLDIYGQYWLAKYNESADEVQLWRPDSGFGLWCYGENIVRRLT